MKHLFIALCVNLLIASLGHASATINQPVPDFTLTDTRGKPVSLSEFRGQTVVLEWTNHLCPYVQKHYDSNNMQSLQSRYTKEGVVWLSIISSAEGKQGHVSSAEANQLTETRNASPTAVLFDPNGEVGKTYNAKTTPHMYLIDKEGMLRYQGAIDSIKSTNQSDIPKAENYLESAMTSLTQGEAIKRPVTAPYGCSVKYK